MKKIIVLLVMIIALCGCSTDAETATYNIKQDAKQVRIDTRCITLVYPITPAIWWNRWSGEKRISIVIKSFSNQKALYL